MIGGFCGQRRVSTIDQIGNGERSFIFSLLFFLENVKDKMDPAGSDVCCNEKVGNRISHIHIVAEISGIIDIGTYTGDN